MSQQPTPERPTWTKERIEALMEKESFRYQSIPLPHGLKTPGHDRSSTAERIFPSRMDGESVMDIGCGLGFFCFDAKKRGAGRVLGVDLETENVRKGRILAEVIGEDVEFVYRDLERDPIEEHFDHVLCLNVLHHLVDPIHSLDRLISCTNKRLILEVATLGSHDRRMLKMNALEKMLLERLPVMVIGSGGVTAGIKQFYFTKSAIVNLLRYRRGCFASVDVFPSDFKGRFIVVGHMRQVDQELVIASPMMALDETLTRCLKDDPRLCEGLHCSAFDTWTNSLRAENYFEDEKPHYEKLRFHYDFLRPFATGSMTYSHDPSTEVMTQAQTTHVATAWLAPDRLLDALQKAAASAQGREKKRLVRTIEECREPERVIALYRRWFEFTRAFKGEHLVVDLGDPSAPLRTPGEWEADVAQNC